METCIVRSTGEEFTALHEHRGEPLQAHPIKPRSRHKHVFTNQIDELIRAIYLYRPGAKTGQGIRVLAKKVGMPEWVLPVVWPKRWELMRTEYQAGSGAVISQQSSAALDAENGKMATFI